MDEKKPLKISLSTFFLILAIIVIVVMGFFMYKLYNEKSIATQEIADLNTEVSNLQSTVNDFQQRIDNISNTTSSEEVTNNTPNQSSSIKLQLGEYTINGMEVTPDPDKYGISSITLEGNNNFSVDMPLGNSYIGTYKIQDNKLICTATKETNVEGGNSATKNANITFEFEIISSNELKFSNVDNKDLKLTIGMTYSIKSNTAVTRIEGEYWPKLDSASDAPSYMFFIDGTVELRGNFTQYGTYEINNNIIKSTFTRQSGPDGEDEKINETDTLTIVDNKTLLDTAYNTKYVKNN